MRLCKDCKWFKAAETVPNRYGDHLGTVQVAPAKCGSEDANREWGTDPVHGTAVINPCMSAMDMRHYGPCGWDARFWQSSAPETAGFRVSEHLGLEYQWSWIGGMQ